MRIPKRCVVLMVALCVQPAFAQTATVSINANTTYQTMDGFGVAQVGAVDPNNDYAGTGDYAGFLNTWPEPQRSQILDLAFSQASGIGLTIFRTKILTSLETTSNNWNYNDSAQVALMSEAIKRSNAKLIATVSSPPAWMKTNLSETGGYCVDAVGNNTGVACCENPDGTSCANDARSACPAMQYCISGYLDTSHYQDFADYLSHYASQYAVQNGIHVYALSIGAEPDTNNVAWATCSWNTDQIASFLGNQLSTTFSQNAITTKVMAPEAANWDYVDRNTTPAYLPRGPYLQTTENTQTALNRLDIAAGHVYAGNPAQPFPHLPYTAKRIWQTETSLQHCAWCMNNGCGAPKTGGLANGALAQAVDIHNNLTGANTSAWLWWNLFLWADSESLIAENPSVDPRICTVDPSQYANYVGTPNGSR